MRNVSERTAQWTGMVTKQVLHPDYELKDGELMVLLFINYSIQFLSHARFQHHIDAEELLSSVAT